MKDTITSNVRIPKVVDDWVKQKAIENLRSKLGEMSAIVIHAYKLSVANCADAKEDK